jgi:hypothetical protein
MVVMKEGVKESSLKRSRQQDLPTPESPMRSSLIYWDGNAGQQEFVVLKVSACLVGDRSASPPSTDKTAQTGGVSHTRKS